MEIRNAIYGDIILDDYEAKIIDSYEMQRLKLIKQLGFVSFVYPCANHTRFEHSLGTRWLAQKIVRLSKLPLKPDEDEEKVLYVAALLHDIAEPCFVHVTERLKEMNISLKTHKQVIEYVLNGTYKTKVQDLTGEVHGNFICDVLEKILNDDQINDLKDILVKKTSKKLYLKEIIDGYIDADNLDYLHRDSFYTGLPYGNYDDRIFSSFKIVDVDGKAKIGFRNSPDTINAIMSVLNARYVLRKSVYLHHTALSADQMFLQALKIALTDKIIDEYDIFILGDQELLYKIINSKSDAKRFVNQLLQRKLFKRAYMLDYEAGEVKNSIDEMAKSHKQRQGTIKELANKSGLNENEILLGFPAPIADKEFGLITLASDNGGSPSNLNQMIPLDLNAMRERYRSLWKFYVYYSKTDYESLLKLHNCCEGLFEQKSKYSPKRYDL